MSDELSALPISGESFLLRRGRRHILVDGGYYPLPLAKALENHAPDLDFIDVVVCTHADGDHAGGLCEFLDKWPSNSSRRRTPPRRNVGEFWLPGRWADVLPDLARNPRQFVDNLIAELDEREANNVSVSGSDDEESDHVEDFEEEFEQLDQEIMEERAPHIFSENNQASQVEREEQPWDSHADEDDVEFDDQHELPEPEWFSDIRQDLIEKVDQAKDALVSARQRIYYRKRNLQISEAIAQYWLRAIKAAGNIRKIAESSVKYHVPIRWFDYEAYSRSRRPQGGIRNFLVPLNAVEQAPAPRIDISYIARLSPFNRACLTFLAPSRIDRLGVIFCGDSPMGDGHGYSNSFLNGIQTPILPMVATAPHHGAETNRIAYQHLQNWPIAYWLRTGGTKKHPGRTFQNIIPQRRACTHCPKLNPKPPKQLATVSIDVICVGGVCWFVIHNSGYRCNCK